MSVPNVVPAATGHDPGIEHRRNRYRCCQRHARRARTAAERDVHSTGSACAAEPAAPRAAAGRIRAVSKADDAGDDPDRGLSLSAEDFRKYLDSLPEDERGRLQLRAALSQPIRIDPR